MNAGKIEAASPSQDQPTSWIVKVKCAGKEPMWVGNFQARGREAAKLEARRFASRFVPLGATVIAIAQGSVSVKFEGPEILFDREGLACHDGGCPTNRDRLY